MVPFKRFVPSLEASVPIAEPQVGETSESEVYDDDTLNNVRNLLTDAFSKSADSAQLSSVVKNMEKLVETKRNKWPLSFLRTVADHLIENVNGVRIARSTNSVVKLDRFLRSTWIWRCI